MNVLIILGLAAIYKMSGPRWPRTCPPSASLHRDANMRPIDFQEEPIHSYAHRSELPAPISIVGMQTTLPGDAPSLESGTPRML